MGAYIVDRDLIRYLVSAATADGIGDCAFLWHHSGGHEELRVADHEREAEVGRMLWTENIASVSHRYPGETTDTLPGPIGETFAYDTHERWRGTIRPVELLKAIACYCYQTCEHPGWADSSAKAFCEALRHYAIAALPGYREAPWGEPREAVLS
jgi:hypothetical protein